jgi:RimJ/RimL family protein N-acetyltransferase
MSIPPAVILRDVIENDLLTFYEQQLDPDAASMAAFPPRDHDSFLAHWYKIMADETNVLKTILYQDQVAGNIVSFIMSGEREVGYWLGKDFWGKGIATQALNQFLLVVTERPLYAYVAKQNLASQQVLTKCGFNKLENLPDEAKFILV